MDEIELVIKIPKNTYRQIQALARNNYFEHDICGNSMRRIANGIPLPKGHGGLISVKDAVDNLMEYKEIGIFGNYDKLTILGCIDRIKNHVEPIIEEDKE